MYIEIICNFCVLIGFSPSIIGVVDSVGVGVDVILSDVPSPTAINAMFSITTDISSSASPSFGPSPPKKRKRQHQLPIFLTGKFYYFEIWIAAVMDSTCSFPLVLGTHINISALL